MVINTNKFIVDLSKITTFTQEMLDAHQSAFNPNLKPEFFYYQEMGIAYSETGLEDASKINDALENSKLMEQSYRKGSNKKYSLLLERFRSGFDLRGKQIFVVYDINGKIIDVFGGNTTHSIIDKNFSQIDNRIVHKFVVTEAFSFAKLLRIGGRQNSLELEFDPISWDDTVEIIRGLIKEKEIALPKNPTEKQKVKFANDIREEISYIANGRHDGKEKNINALILTLEEEITDKVRLQSVKGGATLLEELRKTEAHKYEDNKYTKWLSYSANYDKILPGFAKQYRECKNNYDIDPSEFPNPLKINFNVVVHFGTPDPRDEVNFIKDLFTTFIREQDETETFLKEKFMINGEVGYTSNIEGFYNPSEKIKELSKGKIPMGKVMPRKVWEDFFNQNNS